MKLSQPKVCSVVLVLTSARCESRGAKGYYLNQLLSSSAILHRHVALQVAIGVKINKLQVPAVIEHGAPVVLDCDFTLEEKEDDLVLKWYFNNKNQTLVYQWIPASRKKPQDLGILKGRLNLEYVASVDANSRHRALHIIKPGPDLSGDYTCSVSTMQSEDIRTKSMLVFVPQKNLKLHRLGAKPGYIRVQCIADGVFPQPQMTLRSQERGEIFDADVAVKKKGQLYEVTATGTLPALQEPEEFSCELKIPRANYTVKRETVFYPGNNGAIIGTTRWLTAVHYVITLWMGLGHTFIGPC